MYRKVRHTHFHTGMKLNIRTNVALLIGLEFFNRIKYLFISATDFRNGRSMEIKSRKGSSTTVHSTGAKQFRTETFQLLLH